MGRTAEQPVEKGRQQAAMLCVDELTELAQCAMKYRSIYEEVRSKAHYRRAVLKRFEAFVIDTPALLAEISVAIGASVETRALVPEIIKSISAFDRAIQAGNPIYQPQLGAHAPEKSWKALTANLVAKFLKSKELPPTQTANGLYIGLLELIYQKCGEPGNSAAFAKKELSVR